MDVSDDQALEAAALLIQEGFADRLTLERVADASDLPLTEVERRWPTVEHLVAAVGTRAYQTHVKNIADAIGPDETPGAFLRGYLEATFPTDRERDNFALLVATLFRSAPVGETVLGPVRAKQRDIEVAIAEDGLDPVMARILRYAIDGLYMSDVFGLNSLTPEERHAVCTRIKSLTHAHP